MAETTALDKISVAAGMAEMKLMGITDPNMVMLARFCLARWAKGEEGYAEDTAVHLGLNFGVWRRILAAAMAGAPTETTTSDRRAG